MKAFDRILRSFAFLGLNKNLVSLFFIIENHIKIEIDIRKYLIEISD